MLKQWNEILQNGNKRFNLLNKIIFLNQLINIVLNAISEFVVLQFLLFISRVEKIDENTQIKSLKNFS